VAGVVGRIPEGGEILREAVQDGGILDPRAHGVIEMHSGEHGVPGRQESLVAYPAHDVVESRMGAGAEYDGLVPFADHQGQFVGKIVARKCQTLPHVEIGTRGEVGVLPRNADDGIDAGSEFAVVVHGHDAPVVRECPVHANIEEKYPVSPHVAAPRGRSRHIDGSGRIRFPEGGQTAGVIAVAVGEDGEIHLRQVAAEERGVLAKEALLARVQEDLFPAGFDVEGQAVLGLDGCVFGRVFDEQRDFHGVSLLWPSLVPRRLSSLSAISANPAPHSFEATKAGRLLMRPLFEENRIIDLIAVLDLEDFQCFWESIPVSYKTDKAVFNELFAGENNRILGLMFRFLPDTDRGMFFQLLDSDLRLKLYAQLTGDSVFDFYEMELAAF